MKLNNLRKEIDLVDQQIAKLLNKRFLLVDEIKTIKSENSLNIENIQREHDVINQNIIYIDNVFHNQYKAIYEVIFKTSKAYQQQ